MSDDDRRYVHLDGAAGPFTLRQIARMRADDELAPTDLFWSDRQKAWLPVAGVLFDVEPGVSLAELSDAGFLHVEILPADDDDCPACVSLAGVHPLSQVPALPPADCTCTPWCRCVIAASDEGLE